VPIGEFMYNMVQSYFGDKFTILQTSYDDRIELLVRAIQSFDNNDIPRDKLLGGACPFYPTAFDKWPFVRFIEDIGINFFEKGNDNILHKFAEYNVSLEMRDECNKSFLDSIASGTPMLSVGHRILAPNIYKHENNLKTVSMFDYKETRAAIDKFKNINNKLIQQQFITDANKAKEDLISTLNSIRLNEFIYKEDLDK